MKDRTEIEVTDRSEFDTGTLFWLLAMATALGFFIYMTNSHSAALNIPFNL